MNDFTAEYISIFEANISRAGATELLEWLKSKDFFTAPASTQYHENHEGGLCEHSVTVYKMLDAYNKLLKKPYPAESVAIAALLHDVCKVAFYKESTRNVKNEAGNWEKVPYYTVEDSFPFGHGEKSVWLVERFMRLNPEEAMAIRWHMGAFDESVKGGARGLSLAYEKYPLAYMLNMADMSALYLNGKM